MLRTVLEPKLISTTKHSVGLVVQIAKTTTPGFVIRCVATRIVYATFCQVPGTRAVYRCRCCSCYKLAMVDEWRKEYAEQAQSATYMRPARPYVFGQPWLLVDSITLACVLLHEHTMCMEEICNDMESDWILLLIASNEKLFRQLWVESIAVLSTDYPNGAAAVTEAKL